MTHTTEHLNELAREGIASLQVMLTTLKPETIEPATVIELMRLFTSVDNVVSQSPDLPEFTEDIEFSADLFGEIVMKHLPHLMDKESMSMEMKVFWMSVAEQIGPDWVQEFRKAGAFMGKVSEF